MQILLIVAIAAVASVAMGAGFLAPGFDLNLQNLAAQEESLESPITSAFVDFHITKLVTNDPTGEFTVYANLIDECSFHSPQTIGAGGKIICKLLDGNDNIVAEGNIELTGTQILSGSITTIIPISQKANFDSNDVQNIEKVKIVVLGGDPTP